MKKSVWSVLSAAGVLLLVAACTSSTPSDTTGQQSSAASSTVIMEPGADGQEDEEKDDNIMQEPGADDGQEDDDAAFSAGAAVSVGVDVGMSARIVAITTDNFTFSPNVISVKKGEKITLRLSGMEGNHGFAVTDLGINTPVGEGKTVDVDLPTDKAGTFSFRCSVPCGSGHKDMTGTITIAE